MESKKGLITQLGETLDRYRLEKEVSKVHKSQNGQENKFRQLLFWFIPNGGTILLIAVLIATQSVWAQNHATSSSSSTTTISYQGRLLDSSGLPVNDPGLGITFRLYDTDIGGSPLWAEDHIGVPVQDGLFHVLLGSMNPIPVSLLADTGTLWLGVQVGNDSEMLPREQIASVPYAIVASTVFNGGITTEKIADQAVTQAKLGSDVNLLPPPGSITTAMLSDGAVTSAKLDNNLSISGNLRIGAPGWLNFGDGWQSISMQLNPAGGGHVIFFNSGGANPDGAFVFRREDWSPEPYIMKIETPTGNVGIGTMSPTERLDVAGNIRASGTICDGSGCLLQLRQQNEALQAQVDVLQVENTELEARLVVLEQLLEELVKTD